MLPGWICFGPAVMHLVFRVCSRSGSWGQWAVLLGDGELKEFNIAWFFLWMLVFLALKLRRLPAA
jgi:hypothetical protein